MAEAKGPSAAERLDRIERMLDRIEKRLDRIEKMLGIGVGADDLAAERSERHDELVEGKAARAEAERKKALRAATA